MNTVDADYSAKNNFDHSTFFSSLSCLFVICFVFCSLQRKHERLSAYNLDEEEELTHFGQSLGDMERFDDVQLSEEEVEEGVCGEGRDERRCNKVCVWISYRRHQ